MATLMIDQGSCDKNGNCVAVCPEVFEFDEQGYARVKPGANTSLPGVETAIAQCPTGAIYWE